MKKTEANVRLLVETVAQSAEAPNFDVEAFVKAYVAGETYEPANEADEEALSYVEEAVHNEFDRHKPTPEETWEQSADKIVVKVGEKEFQTFIDSDGVQRFCGNSVIETIVHTYMNEPNSNFNLNNLAIDYYNGKYSSEHWLDFMTSFGYSVSGLLDLTAFQYLPVENPLWENED